MQIPRRILNVAGVAAADNGRYAIAGVYFDSGPLAVATDGRVMLAAAWKPDSRPEGLPVPALFMRPVLETAKRVALATDKKCETIPLDPEQADKDSTFPRYKQVIPHYAEKDCVKISVSPDRLGALLTTISKTLQDPYEQWAVLTVPKDPKKPLLIAAGDNNSPASIVAVAMPRGNDCNFDIMPQLRGLVSGLPENETKLEPCAILEYNQVSEAMSAKRTILEEDGVSGWQLIHSTAGYECAGSCARYTKEKWLNNKFDRVLNSTFGEAFTNLADAKAAYKRRVAKSKKMSVTAPVFGKDPAAVAINQTPVTAKNNEHFYQRPSVKISAPAWMRLPAVYAQKAG